MTDLPSHPDAEDYTTNQRAVSRTAGRIVLTIVGALVALIVVLHLTGVVGPGAN